MYVVKIMPQSILRLIQRGGEHMRFKIIFQLEHPSMHIEYRRGIVSFLKNAYEKQNKDLYEYYYGNDKKSTKPFSFSINMAIKRIESPLIHLNGTRVTMVYTTSDMETGLQTYNALITQKNISYPFFGGNTITLKSVYIEKEPRVYNSETLVRFLSPFVIREHNKVDNKDRYVLAQDEDFEKKCHEIIAAQFEKDAPELIGLMDGFSIQPVGTPKKAVIKHYETYLDANRGDYVLKGHPELIRYFHQGGFGSRKSAGFGVFEILGR